MPHNAGKGEGEEMKNKKMINNELKSFTLIMQEKMNRKAAEEHQGWMAPDFPDSFLRQKITNEASELVMDSEVSISLACYCLILWARARETARGKEEKLEKEKIECAQLTKKKGKEKKQDEKRKRTRKPASHWPERKQSPTKSPVQKALPEVRSEKHSEARQPESNMQGNIGDDQPDPLSGVRPLNPS